MELNYSQLNDIYLVAQVNEADVAADYKKAIEQSKYTLVYFKENMAKSTSVLLNKHSTEPGFQWVACKAHVRTESKLHFDNAEII